ncbi:MAG: hypothetical protein L3J63_02820 [Geopsychrobacter sp.]|nr:hypothetical protein [Geopsychrobacter sp.]
MDGLALWRLKCVGTHFLTSASATATVTLPLFFFFTSKRPPLAARIAAG